MNEKIQLSKDQIQQLFEFTRKKDVKFDDLRIELVDHLASDIEDQLVANPLLTFDEALQNAFAKFPLTGFYHFVEVKTTALKKYWTRKIMLTYLTYFTLPRIFLTLFIAALYYAVSILFPTALLLDYWIIVLAIILLLKILIKAPNLLTENYFLKKAEKKYLFINVYNSTNGSVGSTWATIMILIQKPQGEGLAFYLYILTLSLFTIFLIAIISGQIRKLLVEDIEKKYKHLVAEDAALADYLAR